MLCGNSVAMTNRVTPPDSEPKNKFRAAYSLQHGANDGVANALGAAAGVEAVLLSLIMENTSYMEKPSACTWILR